MKGALTRGTVAKAVSICLRPTTTLFMTRILLLFFMPACCGFVRD
jgi:hypothetical protein